MSASLAVMGFVLVLVGTVATMRSAHRGAGLAAGVAALACAVVLAATESRWSIEPSTWLRSIALGLAALAQLLRVQQTDLFNQRSEVR